VPGRALLLRWFEREGGNFRRQWGLNAYEKLAADLAAVARADEVPISEAIREAIEHHITARRTDKVFKERLKRRVEEDREVLERLAE
jgi:post-segregation antitoxin (ccd killing protein)